MIGVELKILKKKKKIFKSGTHIHHVLKIKNVLFECVDRNEFLGIHFCASGSCLFAQEE